MLLGWFLLAAVPASAAMLGTNTLGSSGSPYKAFTVKSWMKGNLLSIKPSARRININWEVGSSKLGLEGKTRGVSLTRIYENLKGKRMFRGSPSGSGFKLEAADQTELFRVSKDVETVTITQTKGNMVWEIRREREFSEVYQGKKYIGSVQFRSDIQVSSLRDATGRELYFMPTDRRTDIMAFLLLPEDIPLDQKAVMMSELLVRER